MKLVHIISGLNTGGAEMMLFKLLSVWDRGTDQIEVISLTDIGPIGGRIRELNIPVRALNMRGGHAGIAGLVRLSRWLRGSLPDVVQTWMYHADLVGGLAAKFGGRAPVIWGIRNGVLERQTNKRSTIWTAKACARMSGTVPARIICNSENARRFHVGMGYREDKTLVIPNGFDTTAFKPDSEARSAVRSELGLTTGAPLIGLVARFDPQKDHRNFILAAGLLAKQIPEARFVLCGDGVDHANQELDSWIHSAGLKGRVHLLGRREGVARVMAALDVLVSSSYSEAFPNVVGEAMACGVPCVVTDAGDSAFIVGDTGKVVPPKQPEPLAGAMKWMIELGVERRKQLGEKARRRVQENFDLCVIRDRYAAIYREVAANRGRRTSCVRTGTP